VAAERDENKRMRIPKKTFCLAGTITADQQRPQNYGEGSGPDSLPRCWVPPDLPRGCRNPHS
jgi:hypothetical protein